MTIKILIADDHELVRAGLNQLLNGNSGIIVTGEAVDGAELLLMLPTSAANLLLLDFEMPGESGVELISHLSGDYPELKILVLSVHEDVTTVSDAIHAGASGYISKNSSPAQLIAAIRKLYATGRYLDPAMSEELAFAAFSRSVLVVASMLTKRELEIYAMLINGSNNTDISLELKISDRTVSTHKCNLMHKLRVKSMFELMHLASMQK